MTLYVDEPRNPLGRMLMAHMTADYLSELLSAADALGIDRRHFQGPPDHRHAHYDICKSNHRRAIAELGAQQVGSRILASRAKGLAHCVRVGLNGPRPARIKLSRSKGFRKPAGAVTVDRNTKWGNPFNWQDTPDAGPDSYRRSLAVEAYREALYRDGYVDGPRGRITEAEIRDELAGKALACWCPLDGPCHAETLLTVANTLPRA